MNKTRIAYVATALVLSIILVFLVVKTRNIDFDSANEIVSTLRTLKQIDAEWNVDVLRSKTGLALNYDAVASPLSLISSLGEKIQNKTNNFVIINDIDYTSMRPLLDKYKHLMNKKITMIEHFKSQHAILTNSSHFLPIAVKDLIDTIHTSGTNAEQRAKIETILNYLLINTITYAQNPENGLKEKVEDGVKKLQAESQELSADAQERIDILVTHVSTILKQQQIGNILLADLSGLRTAAAIDELSDAFSRQQDRQLVAQQQYRQALVVYSIFLLVLLAYFGWRLFKIYRFLNKSNIVLKKTNEESQVQLRQAEKMAALGQMVAGIAHEINTPLAYVKGTLDVMTEQLDPVRELANQSYEFARLLREPKQDNKALNNQFKNVESISRDLVENSSLDEMLTLLKDGLYGIEQITEIVLNLKNFSRLDRARVGEFSVEEGLSSTLLIARHMIKDTVEVRTNYQVIPKISCSPSQLNQVFLNLITNSVHAMGGREEKGVLELSIAQTGPNMVQIDFKDNGAGIPKDVLPKIFDPFFTTKTIGKGTGMGLSISYKIIEEHGGRIKVVSEVGIGTTFSIFLPIRESNKNKFEENSTMLAAA